MALTPEQQQQLDELTALAKEPEPSEDFEMEIYDGPKGARIPYSKGRKYLQDNFGIDLDPDPATESGDNDDKNPAAKNQGGKGKAQGKESGGADPNPAGRTGHWSGRIDRHQAS